MEKLSNTMFTDSQSVVTTYDSQALINERAGLVARITQIDALLSAASNIGVATTQDAINSLSNQK